MLKKPKLIATHRLTDELCRLTMDMFANVTVLVSACAHPSLFIDPV